MCLILLIWGISGCTNDTEMLNELKNVQALESESTVKAVTLSASDKESLLYAQVSKRRLLDLQTLEKVSEADLVVVMNYMDKVDAQLVGNLGSDEEVIDEHFTNYLLYLFQRTPYYWQRSKMVVRGVEMASRSVVVDVTYNTIDFKKEVQGNSLIVRGEPYYEQKMAVRFRRWVQILSDKLGSGRDAYQDDLDTFTKVYGAPEDIIARQRGVSLTEYIHQTGNQKTYTGLVDTQSENTEGELTVRYILGSDFRLGINLGLFCKSMYILDYQGEEGEKEERPTYTKEGSAELADSVYDLLYRYYQAMDEDDYTGLYGIVNNFGALDKHFMDRFDITYRKHEDFSLVLYNVEGKTITCGVDVATNERVRGSNMTLPLYKESYLYTIALVDGKLQIMNETLLAIKLEGEPVITIEEVDTTGFSASVELSNEDKVELEQLIADFGVLQVSGDMLSQNFGMVVDLSLGEYQLSKIKKVMSEIGGNKRVTWLNAYLQGKANYASVKCREIFQQEDGVLIEAGATYDFINKGGNWYIYNYELSSIATLDSKEYGDKSALCVVTQDGVEVLNSQVKGENDKVVVELKDMGVEKTYSEYTPKLKQVKGGVIDSWGVDKLTEGMITEVLAMGVEKGVFEEKTLIDIEKIMDGLSDEARVLANEWIMLRWNEKRGVAQDYVVKQQAVLFTKTTKRIEGGYDVELAEWEKEKLAEEELILLGLSKLVYTE